MEGEVLGDIAVAVGAVSCSSSSSAEEDSVLNSSPFGALISMRALLVVTFGLVAQASVIVCMTAHSKR